jgi:signal transduction histidine kinase
VQSKALLYGELHQGVGLRSMRERAEMLGGDLHADSRPGGSTRVELRVPLDGRS